jgi:hypothetical protein
MVTHELCAVCTVCVHRQARDQLREARAMFDRAVQLTPSNTVRVGMYASCDCASACAMCDTVVLDAVFVTNARRRWRASSERAWWRRWASTSSRWCVRVDVTCAHVRMNESSSF